MLKILAAVLLLFVGIIPASNVKTDFERDLKGMIYKNEEEQKIAVSDILNVPEKKAGYKEISADAQAALFLDFDTGEVFYSKNKDKRLSMASTTKLMTALIAIEELGLNQVITIPSVKTRFGDAVVGLASGDKVKVSELLHGLLIESGSDAALSFSHEISGSETEFAKLMNKKAKDLGLLNTNFQNSIGYDDASHYSTASDLAKLARVALSNKTIAKIVAKKTYYLTTESGKRYYLVNTNKLIGGSYKGIKTGTTYSAGECLISLYNDGEREIIGVVLGSGDRFTDTKRIIEWTKKAFSW